MRYYVSIPWDIFLLEEYELSLDIKKTQERK